MSLLKTHKFYIKKILYDFISLIISHRSTSATNLTTVMQNRKHMIWYVQAFAQPWCFESISNYIKLKDPIASTEIVLKAWIWLHVSARIYLTVRDSTHQ